MNSQELRKKFFDFFEKRGHKIVPSSSLIPNDASVLFTTAGMQQFTSYLIGEKDPIKDFGSRHLISCQKCFRSDDIDEVGDDTHHTLFEMLGNWSIGEDKKSGYFREGAIKYAFEFLIDELGFDKNKFWITIFKGNEVLSKDIETKKIWLKGGILKEMIREFNEKDNLWGPVAKTGPCGPSSEIHYQRDEELGCNFKDCGPNCPRCKKVIEIWNLVFMEYFKNEKGDYQKLSQRNVDTGIGFERVLAILNNKPSAYETDLFWPIILEIEKLSQKKYEKNKKFFRIIADHLRGSVFLIAEGVFPSNTERGYVLRRIIRRAVRYGKLLNLPKDSLILLSQKTIEIYKNVYPEIKQKENDILTVLQDEKEKFELTLGEGLIQFEKLYLKGIFSAADSGLAAFDLYQSYGFPLELTEELAKEKGLIIDKKTFQLAFEKHQEVSRAGAEAKFGGLGKEAGVEAIKLHTATHLLHTALRKILGEHVKQMGSDINTQRLRFDFSHSAKVTLEEIKELEDLINQKIKENIKIKKEIMVLEKALKSGALSFFKEKYPPQVSVYSVGDFSKEICAGPHVEKTSDLGYFKIVKEESAGAGIRRIRAILK